MLLARSSILKSRAVWVYGHRHNVTCIEISLSDGSNLPWVNEMRYLGIFMVRYVSLRCCVDYAKRSFYFAANANVILQLIIQKRVPVLLYGLEVWAIPNRTWQALDFTMNRVLMKLLKTSNIEVIEKCSISFMSNCHLCSFRNVFINFRHSCNQDNTYCYSCPTYMSADLYFTTDSFFLLLFAA